MEESQDKLYDLLPLLVTDVGVAPALVQPWGVVVNKVLRELNQSDIGAIITVVPDGWEAAVVLS